MLSFTQHGWGRGLGQLVVSVGVLGSLLIFSRVCHGEPGPLLTSRACTDPEQSSGARGTVSVGVETIASGLTVPWSIAFMPNGDILVTERPGRVRRVAQGRLLPNPVMTLQTGGTSEGGLLGLALHPQFATNRLFYLYYTMGSGRSNRVERFRMSADFASATSDRLIVDGIPGSVFHDGGRLRFGPDGMLYIGTGDARSPNTSQDMNSLAGKILRVDPDGGIPADNPFPGNRVYILGVRNMQAFDWINNSTLVVADHGPSGELSRSGHDEVSVVGAGGNLGWPTIYGCETASGLISPIITWSSSHPPGGGAIYRGTSIPQWRGDFIFGVLGARHLHRVKLNQNAGVVGVDSHDVYFGTGAGALGRIRDVVSGPDNELYITTSNCDGRGSCGSEGDKILKVVPRP